MINDLQIRQAVPGDWPAIKRIFEEGIATGHATFTPSAPGSWDEWASDKILSCCLIASAGNGIVGWVALTPTSRRAAYAGVAAINIYVERESRGRGVGSRLLHALIDVSEAAGIWTLEARIFPENLESIHLHMQNGFRTVGVRSKIGRMASGPLKGEWRDVLLLERRSARCGL